MAMFLLFLLSAKLQVSATCIGVEPSLETLAPVAYSFGNSEITYYAAAGSKSADSFSRLWSASKIVSSALVFNLREKGILDNDAMLSAYFDWWTSDPADPRSNVTLKSLQAQIAGFGDFQCGVETSESCARAIYNRAYGIYKFGIFGIQTAGWFEHPSQSEVFVGSHWFYAESNWILVTAALEKLLGYSFQEIWNQHMAEPLGIETSNCYWVSFNPGRPIDSGADLVCSLREYSKFLHGYFTLSYLPRSSTDTMETPHNQNASPINSADVLYGIGTWLSSCENGAGEPCNFAHSVGAEGAFPAINRGQEYWAMVQRNGGLFGFKGLLVTLETVPALLTYTLTVVLDGSFSGCLEECASEEFADGTCGDDESSHGIMCIFCALFAVVMTHY